MENYYLHDGTERTGPFSLEVEAPIKLTTSGRGKVTTFFAGEDFFVQVC
jgi:hypothetical protein